LNTVYFIVGNVFIFAYLLMCISSANSFQAAQFSLDNS